MPALALSASTQRSQTMALDDIPPEDILRGAPLDGSSTESSAAGTVVVLVVDADPFLQEMLASGIRLHNPAYSTLVADGPQSAFFLLQRNRIDVVISELVFPDSDRGFEFLLGLEEFSPQLPVILLTALSTDRVKNPVHAEALIAKPPDMDSLLRQLDKSVQKSRESILRGITLESFLQVLQVEKKTCTLTIVDGPSVGRLYLADGELIHAEAGPLRSKAALFSMLSWGDYSIRITESCHAKPTITDRLNGMLMEWCVHKDHGLI